MTHQPIPRNKAIVGRNAFAHEAGIHQHGMLADRRTYEIMDPELVGVPASSLVLGKHSGRHAFAARLEALQLDLGARSIDELFADFKKLADTCREVSDADLVQLVCANGEFDALNGPFTWNHLAQGLDFSGSLLVDDLGGGSYLTTKLDTMVNWARGNSLWPLPFGTACCAIEFMATAASRFDLARFGMERMSFSPRQADVLICAGRVPFKLAPVIRRIYQQMPQPKWVISMGVCASSGGMFNNYAIVQGVDHIVPVDIYLPGCPPRPEMLLNSILTLHERIRSEPLGVNREAAARAAEAAALDATPTSQMKGLLR